jgi:hypothetical protein
MPDSVVSRVCLNAYSDVAENTRYVCSLLKLVGGLPLIVGTGCRYEIVKSITFCQHCDVITL